MLFQEKASWKSLPPQKPQTTPQTGGQLHPVQTPRKQGSESWAFCSCDTCNSYFWLRHQRTSRNLAVLLVVGWETSTGKHRCCWKRSQDFSSLWVTVKLLPLPSTREVLPFQFLTIHQPTALSNIARALFPASWPNST